MSATSRRPPRPVLAFGLLGVLPFWATPLAVVAAPRLAEGAALCELVYAALILSFLGGARWGLELRDAAPSGRVVGLSMLPTLAALAALVLLHGQLRLQLLVFAAALSLVCAWDLQASDLPPWYGRLRAGLTLGAVAGLCLGALRLGALGIAA